ncbi:hypothetical protein [Pseudomonas aeruginosa]|uniref:hypothetical protein n=1 Tax=Pseudomonas aeruginosa TaxID=287 RepID=UPI0003E76781|nr:hypothetical protein [Pseudomonas aeruginosa]AHH49688.1 hypothetical protein AI22_12540 [Pseudomonas aeruginosa YL84]HBN8580798.1 hypothetical protein [Pseudomonas aeruginosa]HBN8639064.1 hypothetical protein [Pseudomonas aeruginosa]HBN9351727.1 hypothetical protein [Pseudomonas aeruginosa]HEH9915218.1 hypothetical protein [Pseudomonas aeruginosa]
MSLQTFEYLTEYVELPFKARTVGALMFKRSESTLEPDVEAILDAFLRADSINRLGSQGWELVSVQPLLRGVTEVGNQNAQAWAYGLAIPMGYLLFFKRASA